MALRSLPGGMSIGAKFALLFVFNLIAIPLTPLLLVSIPVTFIVVRNEVRARRAIDLVTRQSLEHAHIMNVGKLARR
jgi:hypothetical protein